MLFDYSKLRGMIVEKCTSVENFSKEFGKTSTTVGRKLSGKSQWTIDEMVIACNILNIPPNEVSLYFFCSAG